MRNIIIPNRRLRVYDNVNFYPYLNTPPDIGNTFNLFRGFKYNTYEQEKQTKYKFENGMFFNHIKEQLCNNDEKIFKYVIGWIAHMIQYPAQLPNVALLFCSKQGVGKDMFGMLLSKLIGSEHFLSIDNTADLFSKFNQEQSGKLLMKVNEISDRGDCFKNHNVLKSFITRETIRVEPKGFEIKTEMHYCRYVFFTNNENGLYVENSDRRYCMIRCCDLMAQNIKYFKPLWDMLGEVEFIKDAFDYFKNLDLTDFNVFVPPTTQFKESIKINQLSSPLTFIIQFIEEYIMKDGNVDLTTFGKSYNINDDDDMVDNVSVIKEENKQFKDTFRIQSAILFGKYKEWGVKVDEKTRSQKIFKGNLKLIGLDDSKKIKFKSGKVRLGYNISIMSLEKQFQKHLNNPLFKFT